MRHRSLLSAIALASCVACSAIADDFFAISSPDTQELYRIDTNKLGSPTLAGQVAQGTDLYELVDIGDGQLISLDRDANAVLTIDSSDASIISNVELDRDVFITRRGLAIDPDGVVYGLFDGMNLMTLDTAPVCSFSSATLCTIVPSPSATLCNGASNLILRCHLSRRTLESTQAPSNLLAA